LPKKVNKDLQKHFISSRVLNKILAVIPAHYWIVIAIGIKVFVGKRTGGRADYVNIIRRNKSSGLGVVIPGV
jgi:hypothetical protein